MTHLARRGGPLPWIAALALAASVLVPGAAGAVRLLFTTQSDGNLDGGAVQVEQELVYRFDSDLPPNGRVDPTPVFGAAAAWDDGSDTHALAIAPGGDLLLSPTSDSSIGVPGIPVEQEDAAQLDPATEAASIFFDGNAVFGGINEDLDAFHPMEDGTLLLSTQSDATIGTLSFTDADVVRYDPATGTASVFLADPFFDLVGADEDIDALTMLPDGRLLFSPSSDAQIGGLLIDQGDLVAWDPATGDFSLFVAAVAFTPTATNFDIDGVAFVPDEDCANGVDDDFDGLVDDDDPDCAPPPLPPVGLRVRCTHDPLYPADPDAPVTLRAEALDGDGLPVQAENLEIDLRLDPDLVLDPPPPPAAQQANASEVSVGFQPDGDFAYTCRAERGEESAVTLWRTVAVGPWDRPFAAIPVGTHGPLDARIDIVFFADEDEYDSPTDPDFVADVQLLIYEGFYTIPWFLENQFEFNFWIGTDMADSGPEGGGERCRRKAPSGFWTRYAFADSAGIVHRSICRDNAGPPGIFTIEVDPKRLQVVAHESGHRPFGLADEYCCDGGYFKSQLFGPPFHNLFQEEPGCRRAAADRGFDPDACRRFFSDRGTKPDWYLFEPVFDDQMPEGMDLMQGDGCATPRNDSSRCRLEEATLAGPAADPNGSVACAMRGDTYQGDPDGMPFNGDDTFWWCAEAGPASQAIWISWLNAGAIQGSAPDPNGLIPCSSRGDLYAGDPSSDGSLPDRNWYCRSPGAASEAVWVEYNGQASFDRYRVNDSEIDRFEWMLEQCGDDKC